ncbi:MAG: CBS domain-containing protein [Sedimenticola selenatireducens]|uniref:CBS domain-containing protein n=2 Tax=Sedimenticola selenatireducens TaxID=191960 RepID=A0A558DP43_9GAMM|nr:CBS domain-containing protein [Sedimenticola selenatireducens]TVO78348.1 CBS domain-containing protein [Sedimenticola selenatireducens]TVT62794.1 MAG: CBS domain-containing protein [Sedimenticola selenatireducens]
MNEQAITRVRDVMKTDVDTVDGMDTVEAALQKMDHVETKTLIVDKRDENDAYGIVMFSDIARKVLAKDRPPARVNIYEVMTKPVISVEPDMDIRYCARLFDRLHLSRAPVISQGKVLGVVSFSDMVVKGIRKR